MKTTTPEGEPLTKVRSSTTGTIVWVKTALFSSRNAPRKIWGRVDTDNASGWYFLLADLERVSA